MTDQITIPPEALDAATDLVVAGGFRLTSEEARSIIRAALAAWPEKWVGRMIAGPSIILPLPAAEEKRT